MLEHSLFVESIDTTVLVHVQALGAREWSISVRPEVSCNFGITLINDKSNKYSLQVSYFCAVG